MAEKVGIFLHRVGMQVDDLHVGAAIEDFLRAVAVVIVDVQDRHALRALVDEGLGGDGGVVDVAVAAHEAGAGMVARRAAEREGSTFARLDETGPRQRHVMRRLDRIPGAGHHAAAAIEGIVAELAVDEVRADITPQAPRRPGEGQRRAGPSRRRPQIPDGRQEIEIILPVHARGGRKVELLGSRTGPSPSDVRRSRTYSARDGISKAGTMAPATSSRLLAWPAWRGEKTVFMIGLLRDGRTARAWRGGRC